MKNKNFLKKLAAVTLGFVMTLGVGAAGYAASATETHAAAKWVQITSLSEIVSGQKYAIVNADYYLPAKQFTAKNSGGTSFDSSVTTQTDILWTFTGTTSAMKITVNGDTTKTLYVTNDNNGVVCGNQPNKTWSITKNNSANTFQFLSNDGTQDRYLTYASGNFRCYKTSGSSGDKYSKIYRYDSGGAATYTLSFNANGGSGTMDQLTEQSTIQSSPACSFTAPSGKTFNYWSTSSSGSAATFPLTLTANTTLYAIWKNDDPNFSVTHTNFTEITASYTTTFTHNYSWNSKTIPVEAYGVFKNSGGIQMNKNKGTYIKNTQALGVKITKIVCTWTASGANSPTLYVSENAVASASSTSLGKGSSSETTQTYNVTDSTKNYQYFYFDGSTLTGACYLTELKIYYAPMVVHTVTISGGASSIYAGGTTTFNASCVQQGCAGITWESSDSTVASISDNGKVIGLKAGTTTISATCAEGASDSKTLTVTANALSLSPSVITDAQKGGNGSITASLSGVSGQTITYTWSSNSEAVTVTGNTATAALAYNKGGNATITCNATVNGVTFTNTCSVTVLTQDPVVSFDNPPSTGYTGISYDFTALSANIENGEWSWKINGNDFSGDQLDDPDCSIISYTFTEAGSYTITATCTGDDDATATANTTIVITASSSVLTIDKNSIELQKGSEISITPTLVVTGSYADKTTITVTKEGGVTLDKSTTTSGSPVKVTAGSTGGVAKVIFSANGQDVECAISIPSTTTDKITSSDLTATSESYSVFNNVRKNTAVYAGSSSHPAENQISLRSKNSDSGIITTTSGGIISKVTVTWNGTTNDRQLDVYGKNTAYESASDLFDSSKRGELIGTLNYKTVLEDETELNNNEIEIDGSYAYVGVRSRSNATTFSDITFVWTEPKAVESVTAGQNSISVAKGASSQLTWTVLPSDASNKAVEFSMSPELTGVSINESGLVSVDSTATVGDETTIKIASKENSAIYDTVSLTILPTYLDNSKVLGRTGLDEFVAGQSFAGVRSSSNFVEAKYIDGTSVKSYNDGASLWNNVSCFVKNSNNEWETFSMSTPFTAAHNGKTFKFVYTENGYTQTSNEFSITIDAVVIKESLTLYYSGEGSSYASTHDFTKDVEYSATGTVTWSVVDAYGRASITQLGVLTIDGAPTNNSNTMQFRVKAVCGACTTYCTVTVYCEPVTSVAINENISQVAVGAKGTLSATVQTQYARQVTNWESSNPTALSVTAQSSDKLKANYVAADELAQNVDVTITCWVDENGNGEKDQFEEDKQAQKVITVVAGEIPVTEITLIPSSVEIWQDDITDDNKSVTFTPTVDATASIKTLHWEILEGSDDVVRLASSTDSQTKQFNYTGKAGTATIKATSLNQENPQVSETATITVKPSVLTDITLNSTSVTKDFEVNHVFTADDYEGLIVTAEYQSENIRTIDLDDCVITCDTSKVGTSTVYVSYTVNNVTKTKSYDVSIHAPSLNVVKKIVTESHTDPTEHDAGITSGEKLLNNNASISNIEVNEPSYGISALKFKCRYNKATENAVTMTVKIGQETIATENIGNNFNGTITINNTNNASGKIVLSFTNNTGSGTGHGTFYWTSLTIVDAGEIIRTTTYSNNKMSDAMYAFIDEYSDDLSAGKWDTIFSSSEYAALSANDKALFKDGVVSGTDDSGTKTSSKEFADFINKYDEVLATNDGLTNYLDRPLAQTYTITIDYNHDGQTSTVKVLPGDYKLPEPTEYSGYVFQGWTVGGSTKKAGDTISVTGNMTITANWAVGITFTNSAEFNFTGLTMNRFQYVFEGTCPDDAQKSGFLISTTGDADLLSGLTDEQILAGNNEGVTEKNKADNKLVIGTSDGSKTVSVMFYYVDANGRVVKSQVITMSFDSYVTADGFDPSIYEDKYAIAALQYYIAGLQAE